MRSPAAATTLDLRDLRRGGRWTRRQKLKNASLLAAIRFLLFVIDRMPRAALLAAGSALGRLCHALFRSERRQGRALAAQALPSLPARQLVRRSFENAGRNLAESLLLRRPTPAALELVEVGELSRRTLEAALAEGRGVVFVSPHLGPFELVAAAVAELGHRPVAVVRESYDPRLDPIVDAHRRLRGVGLIHRGRPGAPLRIVRALREGRPVGFLPDLPSRVPSVACRLLGRPWQLPVGPQRIAIRCGSPLLVGSLVTAGRPASTPARFALEIRQIELSDDELILTQRVADALSDAIRQLPDHWLWMAPRHR